MDKNLQTTEKAGRWCKMTKSGQSGAPLLYGLRCQEEQHVPNLSGDRMFLSRDAEPTGLVH